MTTAAANPLADRLSRGIQELGLAFPQDTMTRLLAWLHLVLDKNQSINLTAITDPAEAVERHLIDSLAFGLHLKTASERPGRVVDLGTGAGFPGVVIAIAWPDLTVALLDATRKKIDALRELASSLGIPNLRFHHGRAGQPDQEPHELRGSADVVTARAVGPLNELVRRGAGLLAPGGALVFWKSFDLAAAERDEGAAVAREYGFTIDDEIEYDAGRRQRLVRYHRDLGARP